MSELYNCLNPYTRIMADTGSTSTSVQRSLQLSRIDVPPGVPQSADDYVSRVNLESDVVRIERRHR